jgi:bifunctional UDP-N-acetylglucosamine pyrophosphorylase/glucosamine-1-phosphate N-acetyltransferase
VGNLPLIAHVTGSAAAAGVSKIALVVGRDADAVERAARRGHEIPVRAPVMQTERKGTGHAVLMAKDIIAEGYDDVVVLYGDAPLIDPESLKAMPSMSEVLGPMWSCWVFALLIRPAMDG